MKRINFNKLAAFAGFSIMTALFFSSCIKDYRSGETNFSSLQPTVSIVEGGLAQFSSQALVYPSSDVSDTAIFRVDYAATNVAPANETITLSIDTALVSAYNAANGLTGSAAFQVMPDSLYSYSTTQTTVSQGSTYSPAIPFVVFPDKINPTVSYMLPITISAGPAGATVSGNYGTIYYHVIGNPIAGTYEEYWTRWNQADSTGGSATALYYEYDLGSVTFAPNSPTEVETTSLGTGESDIIDFTNTAGVLSNFSVSFPSGEAGTLGLMSIGPASFQLADPINGVYQVCFPYVNGSGSPRFIVNTYIKQ